MYRGGVTVDFDATHDNFTVIMFLHDPKYFTYATNTKVFPKIKIGNLIVVFLMLYARIFRQTLKGQS